MTASDAARRAIFGFVTCLFLGACGVASDPAAGSAVAEELTGANLATSRPYTVTPSANASYADRGQLTDGNLGVAYPLDGWVGWWSSALYYVDVVVDLGRDCTVTQAALHAQSHAAWGVRFPSEAWISVKRDGSETWQAFGAPTSAPADTSDFSSAWVGASSTKVGRWVKFHVLQQASAHLLVDEIQVTGTPLLQDVGVGKFYAFSQAPSASYPDAAAIAGMTAGSKLTDEGLGAAWPLTDWVGWWTAADGSFDVDVDLGKVRALDAISIHVQSRTSWGIAYPTSVQAFVSDDGATWTSAGSAAGPAQTADYATAWLQVAGAGASGRYVKYRVFQSANHFTFVDELQILGQVTQSWKGVDPAGAYDGAFATNATRGMDVPLHEAATGTTIAMVLWYQEMNPAVSAANGYATLNMLWSSGLLGADAYSARGAYRYLELGWLPSNIPAASIADGALDGYLTAWFQDSETYRSTRENDPIWLRPMNEFNGGWTFTCGTAAQPKLCYGGDPLAFRRAWRRLYNIAEKVGAADHLVFVWSPNAVGNAPFAYYPGDGYVDWVGLSVYGFTAPCGTPSSILQGTFAGSYDYRSAYGHKPMMIAEGAVASNCGTTSDRTAWIQDWFGLKSTVPELKAAVWFDSGADATLNFASLGAAEQAAFRSAVQDPYWLK